MKYVLASSSSGHISNRDYIRRAVMKTFPALTTVQGFGLPSSHFQSFQANLNVIWENEKIED